MKNIIEIISPYRLYLHIFQLERYDIKRSIFWIFNNFFKRGTYNKKPLIYTSKIKFIILFSFLFVLFLGIIIYYSLNLFALFFILIIVITQPYVLIILSLIILKPYEFYIKIKSINKTRNKIKKLKNIKIIAVAGSYGKTSVKNILYHILSSKYNVLKTPLSYNTILGISRVVDLELDDSYDFFICELGEFKKGDVSEMCEMVCPSYGIMTGINSQHLERFKDLKNTTASIFELFDYLKINNRKTVINFSNFYLKNEALNRNISNWIIPYGDPINHIYIDNIKFNDYGTLLDFHMGDKKREIEIPLIGNAHINNILGACTLANELGMSFDEISKSLESLPSIPHRFQNKVLKNNYLLIDNSYSSNEDSFRESLDILNRIPRKNKILITPGIVELGVDSDSIHFEIGKNVNSIVTNVILVGNSSRTINLSKNINSEKVIFIEDIKDMWEIIYCLNYKPEETVVLLENDLPDNY